MSEPKTGEAWMQEVRDFADGAVEAGFIAAVFMGTYQDSDGKTQTLIYAPGNTHAVRGLVRAYLKGHDDAEILRLAEHMIRHHDEMAAKEKEAEK